jgi:hypothetical protein
MTTATFETWAARINELADRVSLIEPNPERSWFGEKDKLDAAAQLVGSILDEADAVLETLDGDEDRLSVISGVAQVLQNVAAVFIAASRQTEAMGWLQKLAPLVEDTADQEPLALALRDPDGFLQISRAFFFLQERNIERAQKLALPLASRKDIFGDQARQIQNLPKPLSHAPALFTLNGFGLSMSFTERDHMPDGSFVKTRSLCALFIPVIPIDAYRVSPGPEEDSYYFIGKVPLTGFAKVWRALVLLSILVIPSALWVQSYLNSPSRRYENALDDIVTAEKSAKSPKAKRTVLERYEQLITQFRSSGVDVREAGAGAARLIAALVPRPVTYDKIGLAQQAIKRYRALSATSVGRESASHFSTQISGWVDDLVATQKDAALDAAGGLLDRAMVIAKLAGPKALETLGRKRAKLQRQVAIKLAEQGWTLEALRRLVRLDDKEAAAYATGLLAKIPADSNTVWLEIHAAIELLGKRAARYRLTKLQTAVATAKKAIQGAKKIQADKAYQKLLQSKEIKALQKALKGAPRDQALAVALALRLRQNGDAKAALAMMKTIAAPGLMGLRAARVCSSLLSMTGGLKQAETLLEVNLGSRRLEYAALRNRYMQRRQARGKQLIEQTRRHLPRELENKLRGQSKQKQREIFQRWLVKEIDRDATLERLRKQFVAYSDVVPGVLSLSMIKLRRANRASGKAKKRLLDSAERSFLSIQGDAEGLPSYHLGLGQTYHRLGKGKQGDKQFALLLARKDHNIALAVARAYRELGQLPKARKIAKDVLKKTSDKKYGAAELLAAMARDVDEKETWLKKADQSNPEVRIRLVAIQANRLERQGKLAQADRLYAKVVAHYRRSAKNNSTSANNAAGALSSRFDCTANPGYLDQAIALLEQSIQLAPSNAIVLSNLMQMLSMRLALKVVKRFYPLKLLSKADIGASTIFNWLRRGRAHQKAFDILRTQAGLERLLEVARQTELLGPSRPGP